MAFTRATVGKPLTASMYNELADGQRSYVFTDAADRAAETTMVAGDYGFQVDTSVLWRYTGSTWRMWEQAKTAYTPVLSGFTLGNGSVTGEYGVAAGRVWVSVRATLGSTSAVTGDLTVSLPIARDTAVHPVGDAMEGSLHFVDSSSSTRLMGSLVGVTNNIALRATLVTASSNVSVIPTTATTPFTWATDDKIWVNLQYVTGS